jgi:hypothetical protein
MQCGIKNFRQITAVALPLLDANQNISDFKENNYYISMVYLPMNLARASLARIASA